MKENMKTGMKIVRLMGAAARSARIFHDWIESQSIIALPNDREMVMTSAGPKSMRNCAVFPAEIAERVATEFNVWIEQRDYVEVVNTVRTQKEWRKGLPGSQTKTIKMYVGGVHKPRAFTQNWRPA